MPQVLSRMHLDVKQPEIRSSADPDTELHFRHADLMPLLRVCRSLKLFKYPVLTYHVVAIIGSEFKRCW